MRFISYIFCDNYMCITIMRISTVRVNSDDVILFISGDLYLPNDIRLG